MNWEEDEGGFGGGGREGRRRDRDFMGVKKG